MNFIRWDSAWETGIRKIDNQHKELLRLMNELFEAIQSQEAERRVSGMLAFLATYVVSHFQEEEEAMRATGYPRLAAHRASHEDLARQVGGFIAQAQADPSVVTEALVRFLVDWLVHHIEGQDLLMAEHLKNGGVK